MTDVELLKSAASAISLDYIECGRLDGTGDLIARETGKIWNPLTDDGHALRLAVKLGINIQTAADFGDDDELSYGVECGLYGEKTPEWAEEKYGDDPCAATRRAIVRAAAEIGKQ